MQPRTRASATREAGRLAAIACLVPRGSRVADIGTDHAPLPRLLLATGRAAHCIACDVNPRGLLEARRRAAAQSLLDKLELRFGFGLRALAAADRVDVVVLSGLGARSILRILDDAPLSVLRPRRLVLQPQTRPELVRSWLGRHGFEVVDERIVLERRRYYVVLAAEPATIRTPDPPAPLRARDLPEVGPHLVRSSDPLVRRFWLAEARRQARIVRRSTAGCGRGEAIRRLDLARRTLAALRRRDEVEGG